MNDREALEAALEAVKGARTFNLTDGRKGQAIVAAARERLAQLPETCVCGGSGEQWVSWDHAYKDVCPTCHGRGTVYPPALVERISAASGMFSHAVVAVLHALTDTETP